ncbi:MAG: right-handed parallel beta-helix repeat-containing protein [Pseudomonadota bacterium]
MVIRVRIECLGHCGRWFLCIGVLALLLSGCGGQGGSGSDPDASDSGRVDDGASADVEIVPDASDPVCELGPNPDGSGCLLPCNNGWHEGSDGRCHVDCPPFLAEDASGFCRVAACPEGWSAVSWSATLNGESIEASHCIPDCPSGMEAVGEGLERRCSIPCGEGWSIGPDGRCRLDCPAGMSATDGGTGCALVEVGERKACPPGPWDESFVGPNPIYVAQNEAGPDADGSTGKPFGTITEALMAATGEEAVTIHVAEGLYSEYVVFGGDGPGAGLSEVHLIGACAEDVIIDTTALDPSGYDKDAAVIAIDLTKLTVAGITVRSASRGIRVEQNQFGLSTTIRDVRVEDTGYAGISASSRYSEIVIADNAIDGAAGYGVVIADPPIEDGPTTAAITGNRVTGILPCDGYPSCAAANWANGIAVVDLDTVILNGNEIAHIEHAEGILATANVSAMVTGNLVYDLDGWTAIQVTVGAGGSGVVADNRIADIVAGSVGPNGPDCADGVLVMLAADSSTLTVQGNRFEDVQGRAILVSAPPDAKVDVLGNEIVSAPIAMALGGLLGISGNRVFDSNALLLTANETWSLVMEGNEFRDAVDHDFALPNGSIKQALTTANFRIGLAGSAKAHAPSDSKEGFFLWGNRFAACSGDKPYTILVGSQSQHVETLEVEGNVFEDNGGTVLTATRVGTVLIEGNMSIGTSPQQTSVPLDPYNLEMGFWLVSLDDQDLEDVTVRENLFMHYGNGQGLVLGHELDADRDLVIEDNVFIVASLGIINPAGYGGRFAGIKRNDFLASHIFVGLYDQLEVFENRLLGGFLVQDRQAESGQAFIEDNILELSEVVVTDALGQVTLARNEVQRGSGFGLLVTASPGGVSLERNLVYDTLEHPWQGAATTGEGILVTGTPELGTSDVVVTGNRLEGAARTGLLVHGSKAFIEGNMYRANGGDCGGACDLVVQGPITLDDLTGADMEFATIPEQPYGIVTSEDVLE